MTRVDQALRFLDGLSSQETAAATMPPMAPAATVPKAGAAHDPRLGSRFVATDRYRGSARPMARPTANGNRQPAGAVV